MSNVWSRVSEVLCQLVDLLVDAVFLLAWALVNWLLLYGLRHLHPSGTILVVSWLAQAIFAGFTLVIILLHIIHDLKGSNPEHTGFKAVGQKLVDLANHLLSLTINSTFLLGWAAVNAGVHYALKVVPSDSSMMVLYESVAQFFVAIATLWRAAKPMYRELVIIYKRLFP